MKPKVKSEGGKEEMFENTGPQNKLPAAEEPHKRISQRNIY